MADRTTDGECQQWKSPRWIPCPERLPGGGQTVLAYSPISHMSLVMTYLPGSGQWYFCGERFSDITHWMPLPAPPASTSGETGGGASSSSSSSSAYNGEGRCQAHTINPCSLGELWCARFAGHDGPHGSEAGDEWRDGE